MSKIGPNDYWHQLSKALIKAIDYQNLSEKQRAEQILDAKSILFQMSKANFDPYLSNPEKLTYSGLPLHLAVFGGFEDIINLMLEKNSGLFQMVDANGYTIFHSAAMGYIAQKEGKETIVLSLVKRFGDFGKIWITKGDIIGGTPLHVLAYHGGANTEKLAKTFLAIDSELSFKANNIGHTPLHTLALYNNHDGEKLAKILLEIAPSLINLESNNKRAIDLAKLKNNNKMIEFLEAQDKDENIRDNKDENNDNVMINDLSSLANEGNDMKILGEENT